VIGPGSGTPGQSQTPPAQPAAAPGNYLTVAKGLKRVLDRVEQMEEDEKTKKKELAACLTVPASGPTFAEKFKDFFADDGSSLGLTMTRGMVTLALGSSKYAACTLASIDQTTAHAILAVDLPEAGLAKKAETIIRDQAPKLLALVKQDPFKLKIDVGNAQPNQGMGTSGTSGSGMYGSGMGGMYGSKNPMGGMTPPIVGPMGGGSGGMKPMTPMLPPPPMNGSGMGSGMGPGGMGTGGMGTGTGTEEKTETDGNLVLSAEDSLVILDLKTKLKDPAPQRLTQFFEQQFTNIRAITDLNTKRSWPHDLAEATQAYLKAKNAFPQGALPRPLSGGREIAWRPDQRLSWAAALLPYLGDEYNWRVDPSLSWNEGRNLQLSARLVPPLVGMKQIQPPTARVVRYPGVDSPLGPTLFVGMAGLGLDAAEYERGDSATAKKLGVFGYDRITRKDDIKDGLAQTIAMIAIPASAPTPWLAGGGSTVRGVSDDPEDPRPIAPFVCVRYPSKPDTKSKWDGKTGTLAIMADGKVRFIPEDIPAATFRALCTIAGGEKIDKLDEIAPVIVDETERVLKTDGGDLGGKLPAEVVKGGTTAKVYKTPQEVFAAFVKATKDKDAATFIGCITDKSHDQFAKLVIMAAGLGGNNTDKKQIEAFDKVFAKHGLPKDARKEVDSTFRKDPVEGQKVVQKFAGQIKDRSGFLTEALPILFQSKSPDSQGNPELKDVKITGNTATAMVVVAKGAQQPVTFVKVGESWKLELPDGLSGGAKASPPGK